MPPGFEAFEDFCFGVGDADHRVEELEVNRLDRRDDRGMGPHETRQRPDFAGVVHTDFKHRKAGVPRQRARLSGTPQ